MVVVVAVVVGCWLLVVGCWLWLWLWLLLLLLLLFSSGQLQVEHKQFSANMEQFPTSQAVKAASMRKVELQLPSPGSSSSAQDPVS